MECEEQWSEHRHVRAPGCYRGDGAGVRGVSGFDAGTSFESTQSIDTAPKPPPTTSAETTIMCTNSSIVVSQPVCGPPPPGECHRYHVVLLRIESRGGNQLAEMTPLCAREIACFAWQSWDSWLVRSCLPMPRPACMRMVCMLCRRVAYSRQHPPTLSVRECTALARIRLRARPHATHVPRLTPFRMYLLQSWLRLLIRIRSRWCGERGAPTPAL